MQHLTALTAAAKILVFDLGLLRIPQTEYHSLLEEALYKTVKAIANISSKKTMDEKRALLGYFVLSSKYVFLLHSFNMLPSVLKYCSVAICFRRTETLRYTSYLEDCRRSLAESDDHPNDKAAAAVVKAQSILEKICQSPWNTKSDGPETPLPVIFLVNAIEEQLKQFREEYSTRMENNS